MKESQLAEQVVAWLEAKGWDVYQEVPSGAFGHTADIVAVLENESWVIECKNSLSLSVIRQAEGWGAHYRSVAIPALKSSNRGNQGLRDWTIYKVCKPFGVGVIEVISSGHQTFSPIVREKTEPNYMQQYKQSGENMIARLKPQHKTYAKAGSKNGKRFTPYQETIEKVRGYLVEHPRSTLDEILDSVGIGHYSSRSSAKGSLKTALDQYEEDWCRIIRNFRSREGKPETDKYLVKGKYLEQMTKGAAE